MLQVFDNDDDDDDDDMITMMMGILYFCMQNAMPARGGDTDQMSAEEALKYLQFIEQQQRALSELNDKKKKLEEFQRQVIVHAVLNMSEMIRQ